MATYDDVARLALALPETSEGTSYRHRAWSVGRKAFAWERPFTRADLERYGDDPVPGGPIVGVRVEDLGEKEAILAEGRPGFFTIQHFVPLGREPRPRGRQEVRRSAKGQKVGNLNCRPSDLLPTTRSARCAGAARVRSSTR
ncbi:hypothetical protein [Promicromonospora iranensis]|uniref:hypothetical protein n=1 Tax=Promicromonospora iranensis TaxID=1105144 RepID=UPI0023A9B457|nr:hypothetical protein [Promicromonospora iranensis]